MSTKKKINLSIEKDRRRSWDETFKKMDWWDSTKIATAKVMVVGAGALGNEVLKNLALLNIGNLFIVDFDHIEYSNLSRSILFRKEDCGKNKAEVAASQLRIINPNIKIQYLSGDVSIDIGLGVFRRMDVVISCLDNRVARLFINRHCYKMNKIWVDGAIENLGGQLDVFKPNVSCYECQLSPEEWEIINFRLGCADVAQRNANFGSIPTTPISSSIIGAMQAQEAMKIIYGDEKNSMIGQRFRFYGKTNDILYTRSTPLQEECDSHLIYEPILDAKQLSCKQAIGEVLAWLKEYYNDPEIRILLDEEIVLKIGTSEGPVHDVAILKYHISEEVAAKYKNTPTDTIHFTERIMILDDSFPYPKLSLNEVGIPPLQILKVEANEDIHFVELTGDEKFIEFA